MNPQDPQVAQTIVSEYATVLEGRTLESGDPVTLSTLPYPKDTIKSAIRTSVTALMASGQMTDELREFLETAYVSLADYLDDELARLMAEYRDAGARLAAESGPAADRQASQAWQTLQRTSRLAGEIASAMARETEALRHEFQRLVSCV